MCVGVSKTGNLRRLGRAHRYMWHVRCPLGDWELDLELRGTVSRVAKGHF